MNAPTPISFDLTASGLDTLASQIFDDIRALSPDGPGVSRPAFSDIETQVLGHLARVARAHGLDVTEDAGRNLVFSLPRDRDATRWALIGSHVDSVPQGGNFDGLAGVVAGLLVLIEAQHSGRSLRLPVKCIAMRAEESAWFGTCYIGSRALTGQLGRTELEATHRGDGRSLLAHMAGIGIDMDRVAEGPLADLSRIAEYLELHIEQGPILVERNLPAAVVTGIRGNIRHQAIRCIGEGAHSGAVPRQYRHDPVMAMAALLARLDLTWDAVLARGGDLVVTSGMVATDPARHALARIADEVTFSLDIRSLDSETLADLRDVLAREMAAIGVERGVRFDAGRETPAAPALMDAGIVSGLLDAMERVGEVPFAMPSGAGHDAAVFAQAGVPAGMVFVRNRNGSHNPNEAMEIADLMVGVRILAAHLAPQGRRASATERTSMFIDLIETLQARGRGVAAYDFAAREALERARTDSGRAAAWYVLAQLAEDFVDRFDRMPLPKGAMEGAFDRFARHATAFDAAETPDAMLAALGAAARDAARARENPVA